MIYRHTDEDGDWIEIGEDGRISAGHGSTVWVQDGQVRRSGDCACVFAGSAAFFVAPPLDETPDAFVARVQAIAASSKGPNPYIQTQDLCTIDLLAPDLTEVPLDRLAFALAAINRYTGHVGSYSVAQHSVHCASVLHDRGHEPGIVRGALLHDLHEAIVGDVSTPMKSAMRRAGFDFRAFEARHVEAVERRFLVDTRAPAIKAIDAAMCVAETDQLLGGRVGSHWPNVEPAPIKIPIWTASRAEREFMAWADRLDVRR